MGLVFYILVVLVSFGYINHYYTSKLEENRQVTLDLIDNSIAALKANDELINTCYAAYYVVTDCANDFASCDMERTNSELETLKNKKETIYLRIGELTKGMDEIIRKKTNL